MSGKANPIVLIPGFLGSELSADSGVVWAYDVRALHTILNPTYLLPWRPTSCGAALALYDPLIHFLRNEGFDHHELFTFSYDWRIGIEAAARSLGEFVNGHVSMNHGGKIVFIAHSLGCLILRLAVITNLIVPRKIQRVIAAGPPSLGSALAFKAIVEMPQIHRWFDRMYRAVAHLRPASAQRVQNSLNAALMTVQSLLELLPPDDIPIWMEDGGTQVFGAMKWKGWPLSLGFARDAAHNIHRLLQNGAWPQSATRQIIASKMHPTETGYVIDSRAPYGILSRLATDDGDGTVLLDSVLEFGTDRSELYVQSKHDALLGDSDLFHYLNQTL
jgi:hypothetical protein